MAIESQNPPFDKNNPFPARLTERRLLSRPGSAKETLHLVIDIRGSGLTYTCGDSLAVVPRNDPALVDALLAALRFRGNEVVELPRSGEQLPLREALIAHFALAQPTKKFLSDLRQRVTDAGEAARLDALLDPARADELQLFLEQREFIDLAEEFPSADWQPQEFVGHLRKLMPRLYSIASSPALFPDEIHLTVAIVRYRTNDRQRHGVATTFLADRVIPEVTEVPVFVASSHFGLPNDDATDIIMVGPGTGVAPFRAFVQERSTRSRRGRAWLFFGDQHRATDFLYEEEWETFLASGALTRLDTAFSRDQFHKVYVQDRMRENAAELWRWLAGGAAFYVCGDAKRMAKDVDVALHEIIRDQAGMSEDEAAAYIKQMKKDKRYQRDVY